MMNVGAISYRLNGFKRLSRQCEVLLCFSDFATYRQFPGDRFTEFYSAPAFAAAASVRLPSPTPPRPSGTPLLPSPRVVSTHPFPCTSTPAHYRPDIVLFPETL